MQYLNKERFHQQLIVMLNGIIFQSLIVLKFLCSKQNRLIIDRDAHLFKDFLLDARNAILQVDLESNSFGIDNQVNLSSLQG